MRLLHSVKARILAAFIAMAAIVLLVGGSAITLMFSAEQLFVTYRSHARQSLEIIDYVRDVNTLQMAFLDYIRTPTKAAEDFTREMVLDVATTDADGLAFFADDDTALAEIAEVTRMAGEYETAFNEVATGISDGKLADNIPATATATALGVEIAAIYDRMYQHTKESQNDLGPEIAAQQQLQVILIATISLVGLIAGIALAVVTSRWLTGTFARLTGTMNGLAGGNYEMTIAGTEAKNELGDMARALETFRINGQQVAVSEQERAERARETAARAEIMARFQTAFDGVIEQAIAGDFSGRIGDRYGDAEIDRISDNLNGMMGSVEAALSEADTVLESLSRADLRERMVGTYSGAFERLKTSTNKVADKLAEMVADLRTTSQALKLATGEILAGANDLSERTTRQAATIEETSATMERMASTVTDNAERAHEASANVVKMSGVVEASSSVMNDATEAMDRISTSSSKISNIIGLIDDIAFQTNLLALNASVEAARAGEAGKGFAVVAVEVRRLAQSAAQASSEVKVLIEQSAVEVKNGTRLVADVAGRLTEIVEGVRGTATLMESIARDSQEQASGISEINVAVRQMDEMTQHNAALVEEMNASIEQTEGQAGKLDGLVATFTLDRQGKTAPPAKPPRATEEPAGARGLLGKVRSAAKTYFGGAAAEDWNEF